MLTCRLPRERLPPLHRPRPQPTRPQPTRPQSIKPQPIKPQPIKPQPTRPQPTRPQPQPQPLQSLLRPRRSRWRPQPRQQPRQPRQQAVGQARPRIARLRFPVLPVRAHNFAEIRSSNHRMNVSEALAFRRSSFLYAAPRSSVGCGGPGGMSPGPKRQLPVNPVFTYIGVPHHG